MKTLGLGAVVMLAAALQVHAALPASGIVPENGYAEVTVADQASVSGLAVSGTLEKRGPGELVLTSLLSRPGTVQVREGTVTLTEAGLTAQLPESLQNGLAFWVDATTNLVTDGTGNVERWLDARETVSEGSYAYMRAEHDYSAYAAGPRSRKPRRVEGVSDVNGLPLVDFGTLGDINNTAAWLPWRYADGTRGVLSNIRAVFAVAAYPDSNGFLISDWDYHNPNNYTDDFWLGDEVNPKKYFRLFNKVVSEAYKGQTYINGLLVDSITRVPDALGHVLTVMTPAPLTAANFFNGGNLDGYYGTLPSIGGGRVGELLVYTNALTETERLSIESYLQRKWKRGGQVGQIRVGGNGTAVASVAAGATNRVCGVSGGGVWRKVGTGTASLSHDFELMRGPIDLREGTVLDDGFVRRPNRLFTVGAEGLVMQAETGRWSVASTDAANALVKSGAGELTVTGFPANVTQVAVNGGTLRLTQALRDPEKVEPVTIYNNSFEIFDNLDNKGPWVGPQNVWGLMPTGTGWTLIGSATPADATNVGGLYTPADANIWCVAQPAPDGNWVAFIKQGGGWETTFTVSTAGRYRLVCQAAARQKIDDGRFNKHRFNILLNGQAFAHVRT